MIETITHKGKVYPKFQSEGFAARYALPFAEQICKGVGYDIGCNRAEWSLPGSILVDPLLQPEYDAYSLPPVQADYIFSSHCIEHLRNWVEALDYWHTKLKEDGVLFLYLPNMNFQHYWKPWNNSKHIHFLTPEIINAYLEESGLWKNIFITDCDLNYSFYALAEKK